MPTAKTFQRFARLSKVDEKKRQVTGIIASSILDRDNEVLDYESSKPHFEAWSRDVQKASKGKSVGNVRAMHGNVAAGVLNEITFNDAAKEITAVAHITDDQEWKKVLTGTYTGFSIGGTYLRKWKGDDDNRHYTAKPSEVSLVDRPANQDATFDVIKSDGSTEVRKFAKVEEIDEGGDEEEIRKNLRKEIVGDVLAALKEAGVLKSAGSDDDEEEDDEEEDDNEVIKLRKAVDESLSAMTKISGDLAKLQKANADKDKEIADLKAKIKRPSTTVVNKKDDGKAKDDNVVDETLMVKDASGAVDTAASVIKATLSKGGVRVLV